MVIGSQHNDPAYEFHQSGRHLRFMPIWAFLPHLADIIILEKFVFQIFFPAEHEV